MILSDAMKSLRASGSILVVMNQVDPAPIASYLAHVHEAGGTDVHLTAGAPPLIRRDGVLIPIDGEDDGVVVEAPRHLRTRDRTPDLDTHGAIHPARPCSAPWMNDPSPDRQEALTRLSSSCHPAPSGLVRTGQPAAIADDVARAVR